MNQQNVVDLAERAVRAEPLCPVCGSHTIVVARDTGLWLECTSLALRRPLLRRLVTLDVAQSHTRRNLIDTDALESAA